MLLYPLFLFSGDAYWRTPRSPRPSSEYHVLPRSCLPAFTDGEQLRREKMSLWKEHQPSSPVKLELGETVKMWICAWMCVHLCLCVCARVRGERRGVGGGGYFILRLSFFWTHVFASVFIGLCMCITGLTVVGMLVSSSVGYNMLSVFISLCVISGCSWYPRIAGSPRSPWRSWWEGEWKAGLISQQLADVSEKLCHSFSAHREHLN